MIIPAATVKIIGFRSSFQSPTVPRAQKNSAILHVLLDNGKTAFVKVTSNHKELNSLYDFLQEKTRVSAKKSLLDKIKLDLFESDAGAEILQREADRTGKSGQDLLNFVAKKILYTKVAIQAASIVRIPLGINEQNGTYTSRAIIVKTDEKTGKTGYANQGLYSIAISANQLPVEITPVFGKEKGFSGYYRIVSSSLINSRQIIFLIDHMIRTVQKTAPSPFYAKMDPLPGMPQDMAAVVSQINFIAKNKNPQEAQHYVQLLQNLKLMMQQDPRKFRFFKMQLPKLLTAENIDLLLYRTKDGNQSGPFASDKEAIVRLNFWKYDAPVKTAISNFVFKKTISAIYQGGWMWSTGTFTPLKIFSVYNFPSESIPGTSDSWGFMENNIDSKKSILALDQTMQLIYDIRQNFHVQ